MRFAGGLSAILLGTAIVMVQVQVASALTPAEVAQQITVRIDGANTGSGVIIERQGSNYTVVTNWHVVQEKGNYTVYTQDGKQHTISQIKRLPNVDLAVFQFTSNQNYQVAQKGDSDQVTLGKSIYVAGFPEGTSDLQFLSGSISSLVRNPKDGYALVYTVNAFPGMSGGPILDEQGKLVGIHGRANTRPDTNATTVYGIPLKTYLSLASSLQPVATAPPINSTTKFSLAKTLSGHSTKVINTPAFSYIEGVVNSVTFSPDGKTLASASQDTTIKIWNVATGQVIRTLKGDSQDVLSVAFSPDGKTLGSGSWDKTIKIWNVATGQEIRTLKGHSLVVNPVTFSPDGRTLASGSRDDTIKIWNVATGQEIRTLKGHSDSVNSVTFSPDGKTLASGSGSLLSNDDNTIKIWNLTRGQEIRTLKGHSDSVNSVTFSPDGKTLASGGGSLFNNDNTIKIWNLTTGQELRTLKGHSDSVTSVAFSPDGKTLASASEDKTIKIWNVATGQEITTLKGHSGWVTSVTFSPDGKTLASGSTDATIKIWRLSE
jgi:WD40 repeat protein